MKKCDKIVVVKDYNSGLEYINSRFGIFKSMVEFGSHVEVTLATFDDSFSRNH